MTRLSDQDYDMMKRTWPRACIDSVVRDHLGKILLTRRSINPYKGLWHFPGGGILKGETFIDARNRILDAELGIKLSKQPKYKVIGAMEFLEDGLLSDGNQAHSISIVIDFEIDNKLTELIKLNHEASEFAFFDQIPDEMHPIHQKFAEDYNIF
jgi:ADP-ribose pyrophosphatase YjhB (NUDIX family)